MKQPLELDAIIQWEALPSLPSQLVKTIDQVGMASSMDYDIVEKIKYDSAIACRLLKQANSTLYGYAGKISSLQQACGLLGLEMVKNIVFTTPAVEFYQDITVDSPPTADYSGLWKNFAISGVISEWLGNQHNDLDSDVCYAAGLIQGMGKIVLSVSEPILFRECQQYCEQENISLEEAEQNIIGFTHLDVGLKLATAWGYPSSLISVFRCHNKKSEAEGSRLSDTIQLAKFITEKLGYQDGPGSVIENPPLSVWSGEKTDEDWLKKSWPFLEELAQKVESKFE